MDAEITAPTAAAATATAIIEPEKWWRMMVSFMPCGGLLQRIVFDADKIRGAV
jgi:hypothetical protein